MQAQINNIPVQMVSVVNTTGDMIPLRFRFEQEDHTIQTVVIEKTLMSQETNYVGQRCIRYTCRAVVGAEKVLFELKYLVESHKWVLSRLLT